MIKTTTLRKGQFGGSIIISHNIEMPLSFAFDFYITTLNTEGNGVISLDVYLLDKDGSPIKKHFAIDYNQDQCPEQMIFDKLSLYQVFS